MPDRERRDPSREIALDRYWTTVLAGAADPPDEAIDPDLVATVQRVHALDVTPPLSPTKSALSAGQEVIVATGTTLVAPPGTVFELRNEGSAPTSMLDLLWITASTSTESGGATWARATATKSQHLTPPVSVILSRLSVDAGATIPPPASNDIAQSVAVIDRTRRFDLDQESDGSYRNTGDEPLEVYILTVSGASGTPVAGT